jgi:hypothetical protein
MKTTNLPLTIAAAVIILAMLTGCGNSGSPVVTDINPDDQISQNAIANDGYSRQFMGYSIIDVNIETGQADVIPLRSVDTHLNVTGILNNTMGVGVTLIPAESDFPNGLFVLDVTLTHPLASPKFSGFDVKGILMTGSGIPIGPLWFAAQGDVRLNNPDGFTRWWNATEFTDPGMFGYTKGNFATELDFNLSATINPYKYFADVLAPTSTMSPVQNLALDDNQGRGIFSAGASNSRRYEIQFPLNPGPVIKFGYAVDASWVPPTINPPGEVPDDFPIEANQPEAYNLPLAAKVNTLFYDSESGLTGGVLRLQANVHDWQGQMAGDITNEIDVVRLFSQALFSGLDMDFSEETATKAVYTASLDSVDIFTPTTTGERLIVVRAGSTGGPNYQQGFAAAPDSNISAWNAIWVDIVDPDCTADSNNDFLEAELIDVDVPLTGQLCGSADPSDFYELDVPTGFVIEGDVTFHCDADNSKIGLYDGGFNLIAEENVTLGKATLNYGDLIDTTDNFYLKIETASPDQACIYYLETNGELIDVTPVSPTNVTPDGLVLNPDWIDVQGDYVFLYSNYRIWIYDNSIFPPVLLGQHEIKSNERPTVAFPWLYNIKENIDGHYDIDGYDMTDPGNPILYDNVITEDNQTFCVNIFNDMLFLSTNNSVDDVVKIYDISFNPSAPTYIDEFITPGFYRHMEFVEIGADSWLIGRRTLECEIYNITDPTSATLDSTFNPVLVDTTKDMAVDGDLIYFLYDEAGLGKVEIYQKNAGAGITYIGDYTVAAAAMAIAASGDNMVISMEPHNYNIFDVGTPASPVLDATYTALYNARMEDLWLSGEDFIYTMSEAGYEHVDISDPLLLNTDNWIVRLAVPKKIEYDDSTDVMYFLESGDSYEGIKSIVNPGDPYNITFGYATGTGGPDDFDIYNGYMAIAYQISLWNFYDISNPYYIQNVDQYLTANNVKYVGMYGTNIYLGTDVSTFYVYEIQAGPMAAYQTEIVTAANPAGFEFVGDTMYVYSGPDVWIYDITNPNLPAYFNTFAASSAVTDTWIQGDYMYIATDQGLDIYDITDPTAPASLSSTLVPPSGVGNKISVENSIAYMGYHFIPPAPTQAIEVYPPDSPIVLGGFYSGDDFERIEDLFIINGYLYEATDVSGLRIWDLY